MADEAKWYVAHTYSGYENKVKESIEKTVENRGMSDIIVDVRIPEENVTEEQGGKGAGADDADGGNGEKKKGKTKVAKRKLFPGYVMIKMIMTDESWYVVRNTRGVTGFVGPGSKPVPLTDAEVAKMGVELVRRNEIEFKIGDYVEINSGPMLGFSGNIEKVDQETGTVQVTVSMFGRETLVEVNYTQVSFAE